MTSGAVSRAARRAWSVLAALSLSVASTLGPLVPVPMAYSQTTSAVSLNGTTAYVQTTDSPSLRISSNLTIEALAKPTAVVPGLSGVVDKPGYDLSLQPIDNGFAAVLRLTLGGKAYEATTVNAGPLALAQWYHLAGTFDGQVLRVWVNGRELASLAQAGSIDPSPAPLRIGILDGSSIHFAGEIDEVRVSDTVRYTTNFKPTATPFTADTNTRGLWHLDEGSGTTTADASINGNNGNFIGGAAWATDSPVGGPTAGPGIPNPSTSSVESSTATVTWTTDRASDSQVSFGTTSAYGLSTPLDASLVTSHSVKLDRLQSKTPYDYQVTSRDVLGNVVQSANLTFTTTDPSTLAAKVGEWSAARNWPAVDVHTALLYTGDVLTWDHGKVQARHLCGCGIRAPRRSPLSPTCCRRFSARARLSLADGRLLVVGGHNGAETGSPDVNIFDPATSAWSSAPKMALARWYRPGKILFTGGGHPGASPNSETSAEVADLTQLSPAWRATGPMALPRTLLDLPDGKVLAIGGGDRMDDFGNGQLPAEMWDPNTEAWTTLAAEHDARQYHSTAVLLPDGRELVAGGGRYATVPDYYSAEIYSPPYLFKGPRPTIASAPGSTTYGSTMAIATPDASNIASVVLTGLGSVTHTFDMDQRYVELSFTRNAGGVTAMHRQLRRWLPPATTCCGWSTRAACRLWPRWSTSAGRHWRSPRP